MENETGEVGGANRMRVLAESANVFGAVYVNQQRIRGNVEPGGSEQVVAVDLQGAPRLSMA